MQYVTRAIQTIAMLGRYEETMEVSVFVAGASLRRNDYVSFYSAKEALMGDQYREQYPIGATTLTDAHLWDKDYIIKYGNDMYMIGDHTDPINPLGIAQYLNCAMRSSGSRNSCKLVKITINNQKMFVAKIAAQVVNVGQKLFTPCGRGPPSLLHPTVPHARNHDTQSTSIPTISDTSEVEIMLHNAPITLQTVYGRLRCA